MWEIVYKLAVKEPDNREGLSLGQEGETKAEPGCGARRGGCQALTTAPTPESRTAAREGPAGRW